MPDTGYRMLDPGCFILDVGCWFLDACRSGAEIPLPSAGILDIQECTGGEFQKHPGTRIQDHVTSGGIGCQK